MKKRARICFYIFVACAFFALGILGYFVFNPSNDNVMVGSKKFVTFNEVPNASVYTLNVKNLEDTTEYKAYYKVTKKSLSRINNYQFNTEVEIDNKKVAEESYLQEIISEKDETIDCNIKNYQVTFFDEFDEISEVVLFKDQTLRDVNKKTICCVISEYFGNIFIKDGVYNIECSAIDENGETIENSNFSFDYNYQAYYLREFERKPSFFMNGQIVDYVIDSLDEFELFIWHAILYRQNDLTFYNKTKTINKNNINSLTVEAINSYPEYDGLNDASSYAELNGNVGKLFNFNYYLDFNFTKTYKDLEDLDATTYNRALKEIDTKNTDFNVDYVKVYGEQLERNFPIDSVEQEVLVYNTEQLFMAVEYGAKPVFLDENDEEYKEEYAIAKQVYDNARSELAKINNSDNLGSYYKALNIYRYLCQNVLYDYVMFNYMDYKNDFSVLNFGSFNCFYLEGVFLDLDNQYAVCDGLAKAYTLMCRIEGIPCVKVNGEIVYQTGEKGKHAWNKVCLKDTNSNDWWLYVDTTWGVGRNEKNHEEYLTHSYYLFSNDDKLNWENRIVEFETDLDTSKELNYNYYEKSFYQYIDENGILHKDNFFIGDKKFRIPFSTLEYVDIDSELEDVFDYVKYNLKQKEDNGEKVNFVVELEVFEPLVKEKDRYLNNFNFDDDINLEILKVTSNRNIYLFRFYKDSKIESTELDVH